jgi:hypothetical protein
VVERKTESMFAPALCIASCLRRARLRFAALSTVAQQSPESSGAAIRRIGPHTANARRLSARPATSWAPSKALVAAAPAPGCGTCPTRWGQPIPLTRAPVFTVRSQGHGQIVEVALANRRRAAMPGLAPRRSHATLLLIAQPSNLSRGFDLGATTKSQSEKS